MPSVGFVISAALAGFAAGAFVWIPLAIKENDRRWEAKVKRLERYRPR